MADAERLAALLEGRLDERQRAELLERLALSEDDLELLADAAAVAQEIEEEDRAVEVVGAAEGDRGIVPLPVRRPPPRLRWLPLAAVFVGVAVAGVLTQTGLGRRDRSPMAVVDHLASADQPPPAGLDPTPWVDSRGSEDRLSTFARGVQLGVRLADLQLARGRDAPEAHALSAEVAKMLDAVPGTAQEASFYGDVAPGASPKELRRHALTVAKLADSTAVALGAWVQAARIAAWRHDAEFFRRTPDPLDGRSSAPAGMKPQAVAALNAVRADLSAKGPPDWSRLDTELYTLLRTAGR
jgi:hypothetical protein